MTRILITAVGSTADSNSGAPCVETQLESTPLSCYFPIPIVLTFIFSGLENSFGYSRSSLASGILEDLVSKTAM